MPVKKSPIVWALFFCLKTFSVLLSCLHLAFYTLNSSFFVIEYSSLFYNLWLRLEADVILSNIKSPEDLKNIPEKDLPVLAALIRKKIIQVVGQNGGHLASNLGVVELTIALHRVFSSPQDAIIFDVSHQCYAHKILTGRADMFESLRQKNGLAGFTRRTESCHDFFDNGHSSTSISQGLGLLTAWELQEKKGKVIAVIGDGALTGGLALEALNHAGQLQKNLIVVLNDNQMSISKNTGSISKYLSSLTMSNFYQKFRHKIDALVSKLPNSDRHLGKFIQRFKRSLKGLLLSNNFFTDLDFEYVGPLDGHNIPEMEKVFRKVSKLSRPVVVHVITKKGKGYSPAENDPAAFHGIGPFLISDGKVEKFDSTSFTECFSRKIMEIAESNPKIAAITAAMAKGTGLDSFARHYPERFFDVGIAEEHAVTFASGLACGGLIPVVAVYSTFIQRSIDQIIHDVAIPCFHVVFCLDRAGAVAGDGETHQGMFDIALLRPVPNLYLISPATAKDLELCLDWAVSCKMPVALRYPKSTCPTELKAFDAPVVQGQGVFIDSSEFAPGLSVEFEEPVQMFSTGKKSKVLFVSTGGMILEVIQACRSLLMENIKADIYSLRFLNNLDFDHLFSIAKNYDAVVFVEDGVETGGVSICLKNSFLEKGYKKTVVKAFPQKFISQGSRSQILEYCKMSPRDLAKAAMEVILKNA